MSRKKLKMLLLPFLHKDWSTRQYGNNTTPLSPRDDVNVPDLYIPFMALLTYVLLAGISVGKSGNFTPEALGTNLSSGMGWTCVEVIIVTFTMYLINVKSDMKWYDILSYLGYKFVPVCLILLSALLAPSLYWVVFVCAAGSLSFFIHKTMSLKLSNPAVASEDYGQADIGQKISKKVYVAYGIAAVQPVFIWIMTYGFQ